MIKANELRIGNWIQDEVGYKTHKVTCVDVTGRIYISLTGGGYPEAAYSPIPLTPELLEKCGFIRHPDMEGEYSIRINPLGVSLIVNVLTHWAALWDHMVKQHSLVALPTKVEHLHQLQNLYFALTGKELPVNL